MGNGERKTSFSWLFAVAVDCHLGRRMDHMGLKLAGFGDAREPLAGI